MRDKSFTMICFCGHEWLKHKHGKILANIKNELLLSCFPLENKCWTTDGCFSLGAHQIKHTGTGPYYKFFKELCLDNM